MAQRFGIPGFHYTGHHEYPVTSKPHQQQLVIGWMPGCQWFQVPSVSEFPENSARPTQNCPNPRCWNAGEFQFAHQQGVGGGKGRGQLGTPQGWFLTAATEPQGMGWQPKSDCTSNLGWARNPTRWCPFDSVQLVNITPITMVFVGDISIIFMGFINNFLTFGGHHLV